MRRPNMNSLALCAHCCDNFYLRARGFSGCAKCFPKKPEAGAWPQHNPHPPHKARPGEVLTEPVGGFTTARMLIKELEDKYQTRLPTSYITAALVKLKNQYPEKFQPNNLYTLIKGIRHVVFSEMTGQKLKEIAEEAILKDAKREGREHVFIRSK